MCVERKRRNKDEKLTPIAPSFLPSRYLAPAQELTCLEFLTAIEQPQDDVRVFDSSDISKSISIPSFHAESKRYVHHKP
jgi:hypothetical protein